MRLASHQCIRKVCKLKNYKFLSASALVVFALTSCSAQTPPAPQSDKPDRAIMHSFRQQVTSQNLLDQPRKSAYLAEVRNVIAERYFTAPMKGIPGTGEIAIYYHPVLAKLTGEGSLNGTEQYLALVSDSGLDYPISKLTSGTKLLVFLVADPTIRSDGLSETAPSWIGVLDDQGTVRGLSPHDDVELRFEDVRAELGL